MERYCALRQLAARLYRLADDSTIPAHSHARVEHMIDEAETIAHEVRAIFREPAR
jgi:hypothetical protein